MSPEITPNDTPIETGNVGKVLVEDNQPVKEGQSLVDLDPRDLQAKVDQARAALVQAQSQVEVAKAEHLRATVSYAQAKGSDLEAAQATLEARRSSYEKAKVDYQRMTPLAERQEISALSYDAYRNQAEVNEGEWKVAQRRLNSLRQEAEARKANVAAQEARLAQAQAGIAQAKANLEALELQLSYTRITAPVEGVVTRKFVETGQVVQPGQGMMTLVPLHQTWITANYKETQLAKVHPGQEVEIKVDMNGMVLKGKVDSIAGSTGARMSLLPPENAVGNFVKVVQRIPVKIRIDEEDAKKVQLRPGMNVEATILTK
ncbi:MAG: secretion protein HlyD family protein [Holophagaceae bacterium]|nr:secretion protein HlyD family protein [Holophagaceae bacterium]